MFVHENNIKRKIFSNYNKQGKNLECFYNDCYLPMRNKIEKIDFSKGKKVFYKATEILNNYRINIHEFASEHKIMSQSKFESSFLEEISNYLFGNLSVIKSGKLSIFNKGIYAGLKIKEDFSIDIIKKDVDFCIGKKITLNINNQSPVDLIIPAISVEVKTYLDATMFGEIKSSSKTLKSATPNSKAYVLMGYKNIADEHILAARQDSTLDELFVLQEAENMPLNAETLYEYYVEIVKSIRSITKPSVISVPGRLLFK